MTVHLVRRNARSVPWAGEEALAPIREQDSTSHDIGSRTSKPSSSSEEPGSRILRGYCGAKRSKNSSPFHIKPKVNAEEEEMPEDEQRESRLPGYTTEDNPVLGRPRSRNEKAADPRRQSSQASQTKGPTQWASYRGVVEEQFQERLSLQMPITDNLATLMRK